MLIIPKTFCLKCTEFYVEKIARALVNLNQLEYAYQTRKAAV